MLELFGLTKGCGDVAALDGATFQVPPGRVVEFLGPNGSGKATAMRGIFGLLRLDAGEVIWNGAPVDASAAGRFGYTPGARALSQEEGRRADRALRYPHGAGRAVARAQAMRWME